MLSFWWRPPKDNNLKPLENKIQDLENKVQDLTNDNQQIQQNITTLTNQIQQLTNANQQIQQNITNLTNQIQQLTNANQQIQQNITNLTNQIQTINQQLANTAKTNKTNKFTNLQEIQYPDEALSFIQDNNANYIHFKRSDGTRRGYVGIGAPNSMVMDVNGTQGVKIQATLGDINLFPQNSINANNKPIKNIANPTSDNDAINWNYLNARIKTIEGNWKTTTGLLTWPNLQGGVYKVLNLEVWYQAGQDKRPALASKYEITNNNNDFKFFVETFPGVPPVGSNFRTHAKFTYISLR